MWCGKESLSRAPVNMMLFCSLISSGDSSPLSVPVLKFGKQGRRWLKGKMLWGNEINPRGFPDIRVFQGTLTCSRGTDCHAWQPRLKRCLGDASRSSETHGCSWHCFSSACSPPPWEERDMLPLIYWYFLPILHTYMLRISRYMRFVQLYT